MSSAGSSWDTIVDQTPSPQQAAASSDWDEHAAAADPSKQIRNPWLRYPLMAGSELAAGVASIPDLPRQASQLLDIPLTAGMNLLTGQNLDTPSEFVRKNAPVRVPAVQEVTNALGVTNRPDLKPEGLGENIFAAAARSAPFGGRTLPGQIAAATSGAAAETAHEAIPDSLLAPILVGGVTGYGVGRLFQARAAAKEWSQIQKELPLTQQAAKDADSALKAQRDAMKPEAWAAKDARAKATTASLADRDAFIASANAERKLGLAAQESSLKEVADGLGNSQTVEDAGLQLQNASRNWLNKYLPSKLQALWKPLDDAIPADTPADVRALRGTLENINKQAGALEGLARDLKSPMPARWKAFLDARDELADAAGQAAPQITWKDISTLRSMLGDAMADPQVLKVVSQKNLSAMYAGLTRDMEAVAKQAGLAKEFSEANAGSKALFDKAESTFGKIVASGNKSSDDQLPGQVAQQMLRRGATDSADLVTLREEIPEAANHLAAVAIRTGFWNKLLPEAQAALIPDAKQRALVTFSQKAKDDINEAADLQIANAKLNHQKNVEIARGEQETANRASQSSFINLRSAKEAADENAKNIQARFNEMAKAREPTNWRDALHGVLGGGIVGTAAHFGTDVMSDFGVHGVSPTKAALAAGLISYGLPKIARGTKNILTDVVTNPESARAAGFGAAVGSAWQPQINQRDQKNALTGR